jgi:hypothetical protein
MINSYHMSQVRLDAKASTFCQPRPDGGAESGGHASTTEKFCWTWEGLRRGILLDWCVTGHTNEYSCSLYGYDHKAIRFPGAGQGRTVVQ